MKSLLISLIFVFGTSAMANTAPAGKQIYAGAENTYINADGTTTYINPYIIIEGDSSAYYLPFYEDGEFVSYEQSVLRISFFNDLKMGYCKIANHSYSMSIETDDSMTAWKLAEIDSHGRLNNTDWFLWGRPAVKRIVCR